MRSVFSDSSNFKSLPSALVLKVKILSYCRKVLYYILIFLNPAGQNINCKIKKRNVSGKSQPLMI